MKHVLKRTMSFLTLRQLRQFIGNSAVMHKFADRYGLVYFGSIEPEDESRLVKGITLSNTYRDAHYLVGTAHGRDMIFLQRSDILRSALHKRREHYTWNILAFDLAPHLRLPHIYIEGRSRHGHGFYEMLAMKKREFAELPLQFLAQYDPLFSRRFMVHLPASAVTEFSQLVNPERAAIVAHHFHMFDYEFLGDMLYVYVLSPHPTLSQLELMLQAGVWLAGELEKASC